MLAWNTSVLSSLSFTPYQLFIGRRYEPAALQSFITMQEADNATYGEFISAMTQAQHIVEQIVNHQYQNIRQKRYDQQNLKAKNSSYPEGSQVMIKIKQDQTQRCHKLRPRYKGPYKVIREYENNLEVIPWWKDRQIKFANKYKNLGNIPLFEKIIIHKDLVKPCTQTTFQFDTNLARQFYNLFWQNIKEVKPITEVQRAYNPNENIQVKPTAKPSSLILPIHLGISSSKKQTVEKEYYQPKVIIHCKEHLNSDDDEDDEGSVNMVSPNAKHTVENIVGHSDHINEKDDDEYDTLGAGLQQQEQEGETPAQQHTVTNKQPKTTKPRLVKKHKMERWFTKKDIESNNVSIEKDNTQQLTEGQSAQSDDQDIQVEALTQEEWKEIQSKYFNNNGFREDIDSISEHLNESFQQIDSQLAEMQQ